MMDAMDDASFQENKASCRFHILLKFPAGHDLSAKGVYEDAGHDAELDLDFFTATPLGFPVIPSTPSTIQ
jgi:hypothetical protein